MLRPAELVNALWVSFEPSRDLYKHTRCPGVISQIVVIEVVLVSEVVFPSVELVHSVYWGVFVVTMSPS